MIDENTNEINVGPFRVHLAWKTCIVKDITPLVPHSSGHKMVAVMSDSPNHNEEETLAYLFAASPELFNSLVHLMKEISQIDNFQEISKNLTSWKECLEAVDKAKGSKKS